VSETTLLRRTLSATGLLPAAFNAYRFAREWSPRLAIRNRRLRRATTTPPIPPGDLLFSVAISRDVEWFLQSGAATAGAIRDALHAIGRPFNTFADVLDFGCGCGRVMRHWYGERTGRLHGCDMNHAAIDWAARNLPHATFAENRISPPLPYSDGSFDLVYALSVFTHLPEALTLAWLQELHRVLRPGGVLVLTTMGPAFVGRLTPAERRQFADDRLVTRDEGYAGSNVCAAYHSEACMRRLTHPLFEQQLYVEAGARGMPGQDLYAFLRVPRHPADAA
jgi:SAM-dependent methyltransferase